MTRRTLLTTATCLLLAGCAAQSAPAIPPAASSLATYQAWAAALPACSATFVPGKPVTAHGAAPTQIDCKDPDGQPQIIPLERCADGSHMGIVEARTGAPAGWFVQGRAFVAVRGELAADAGWGKAIRRCRA